MKPKKFIKEKIGLYLALSAAIISGTSNFLNKLAITAVGKDAYQYTVLKNGVVVLIASLIVLSPFVFSKIKKLSSKDWLKLILIGIIGGGVPFLLFFKGLSLTSAASASFIHKTLFVWVAILAVPFLKEKITSRQFGALGVLFFGNLIFSGVNTFSWNLAESLIFVATILWAVESIMVKKILKNLDSAMVAWGRMFFGLIALFGYLFFTKNTQGILEISVYQWSWILLTGILLTGYVFTWCAAVKRLPVSLVACVLVLASPITSFLDSIFITNQFNQNLIGLILTCLVGVTLFWRFSAKKIVALAPEIYAAK